MSGGLLSLKWNNHQSTFLHVLSSLCLNDTLSDVTLACDGEFFAAHKLVLATCSEYFEKIFEKVEGKHSVIVLKDIKVEELESLLSYMYEGEVNVLQEELAGLIKAAEYLKVKGLSDSEDSPNVFSRQIFKRSKRKARESLSKDVSISPPAKRKQTDTEFSDSSPKTDPFSDSALERNTSLHTATIESETCISPTPDQETFNEGNPLLLLSQIKEEPDVAVVKAEICSFTEESPSFVSDQDKYDTHPSDLSVPNISESDKVPINPCVIDDGSSTSSNMWDSGTDFSSLPNSKLIGHCFNSENNMAIRPNSELMTITPDDFIPPLSEEDEECLNGSFSCPYCPFKTFQKSVYDTHLRRHPSEKTFSCQFCSYSCMTKSNLKCHIRKHTGEKPFSCPHCNYRSAQSSNIKIHVKRKHKDIPQSNEDSSSLPM